MWQSLIRPPRSYCTNCIKITSRFSNPLKFVSSNKLNKKFTKRKHPKFTENLLHSRLFSADTHSFSASMVSISLFFSRSFPSPLSHIYLSAQEQSPSLEDCLKLLKGERDEQRLAGLLLVTKFCKGDDLNSLHRVYDAVGLHFLDRLLRTGISYIYLLFLFQEEEEKKCWKLVQITCLFVFVCFF